MKISDRNKMCFACGKDNPIGLHLHFDIDQVAKTCTAKFTPKHEHQSYDGRMHGGLITVLLDEVMGTYLYRTEGRPCYTAKMELRFRQPVMVGTTITCIGKEIERKGRLVIMRGEILNPDGAIAAEAEAKMMWGA